jgi:hypothetical protein
MAKAVFFFPFASYNVQHFSNEYTHGVLVTVPIGEGLTTTKNKTTKHIMDPDRVRAYLQVACAGLGFDIGEIWWTTNTGKSRTKLFTDFYFRHFRDINTMLYDMFFED